MAILDPLINKKNELFGTFVTTAGLRSAVAYEVFKNPRVLRSAKFSGKGVMIDMGGKFVVPSNPGDHVPVYDDFVLKYRSTVQHPMASESWDKTKRYPGQQLYVATSKAFHQIYFDPTDPQHILLASLGLTFRKPKELIAWANTWGLKSNTFISQYGMVETPKDFITKFENGDYMVNVKTINHSLA